MTGITPEPLPSSDQQSTRRGPRKRTQLSIAAFFVVGAILAGFLVASVLGGPRDLDTMATGAQPSSAPGANASPPGPSLTAAASAGPISTPAATEGEVATLPNMALATVTVDALNLRASASASAPSLAVLSAGTELFVIGEPTFVADLRWYRVAQGSFDTIPCGEECAGNVGWVATPADGSETWIEAASVTCPESPVSVDRLIAMTSFARLHCFGGGDFVSTGWADNDCCGYVGAISFAPDWLAWPPWKYFRATDFYSTLRYSMPELDDGTPSEYPSPGDIVRFTGHFDDPSAPDCRAFFNDDVSSIGDLELPDPAAVVLACRLRLVVTDYEVIGHEGEGECGCLTPPSPGASEPRLRTAA